jgi:Histidine kinase-, DNA gyrase B-, and HSP90-like ATPase
MGRDRFGWAPNARPLGRAGPGESLNQLAHLVASLLDVSRLQAGALPVFPRPADLREIIARSLDGFGPQARAVTVDLPPDLPQVIADPPIMERVIVNLAGNALRYSPAGSLPVLTADARGDRVELRVIDRGPGIPEAERDRAFMPFQRLGNTGSTAGVGLGLTVSRGLTEAMGGTLEPEETPGGGLTMAISLPVVARPAVRGSTRRPLGGGSLAIVEPVPRSRTARGALGWEAGGAARDSTDANALVLGGECWHGHAACALPAPQTREHPPVRYR